MPEEKLFKCGIYYNKNLYFRLEKNRNYCIV